MGIHAYTHNISKKLITNHLILCIFKNKYIFINTYTNKTNVMYSIMSDYVVGRGHI